MKKSELYEIIEKTNISEGAFIGMLKDIVELRGLNSNLFYNMCINNSDVIDDDNIDAIIRVFLVLCYLHNDFYKKDFAELLDELLQNNYIVSSDDFDNILDSISAIIDYPVTNVFDVDIDEADYVVFFLLKQYMNVFKKLKKFGYDLYKHDLSKISRKYMLLLDDLSNTTENLKESFMSNCMNRVSLFTEFITDDYIFNLDDDKYEAVLFVALSITDVNELSKFKNKIYKISNDIDIDSFRSIIDRYSEELNYNTINLITNTLDVNMIDDAYGNRIIKMKDDVNVKKELKKILSPYEKNVIIF